MENIIRSMQECNAIRYTSYRTAAKMQILHRELNMMHVQLELIAGVFERHRLSITENCVNLDPNEIEDVLSDIYFAAQKESNFNFDVDLVSKLATSCILNIFDKQNTGNILVFSVKVALVLLCGGKLQEKYGYLYQQLADHNACLSRAGLHTLLTNICKITEMLGESIAYEYEQIQSHLDACFIKSQGGLGITEAEFASWIMQEPPLLVWITTFNRIKSFLLAVVHNIRCSSCKVTPVQGPRYTCLKCTGYHQCQNCFLLGKTSNKHKLKHPIREFCVKTSHREITKLILELIRNKLRLCPTRTITVEDLIVDAASNETKRTEYSSLRSTIKRKILTDPQKELQSIIMHLEEENRQLQIELLDIQGTKAERLQRHRATIESQLQRLKMLKKYLFTDTVQAPQIITRMQSTPMLPPISSRLTALPLEFELSPIIRQDSTDQQGAKLQHRNDKLMLDSFNTSSPIEHTAEENNVNALPCVEEASTSTGFANTPESNHIELSTWIGGTRRRELNATDSGFSQWLAAGNSNCKEGNYAANTAISSTDNDTSLIASQSPTGIHRDNTPSSLQRPDKHSQHSSLQNIQGDLNDILDRLQNMVANDCFDESYDGTDNCKLKRATTEMEDLLTGLIEGIEKKRMTDHDGTEVVAIKRRSVECRRIRKVHLEREEGAVIRYRYLVLARAGETKVGVQNVYMAGARSKKPSIFSKLYLASYNLGQTLGWSYILYQIVQHYIGSSSSSNTLWSKTRVPVVVFQNAAVLEIIHAGIGLVPSNVLVTLAQVFSRVMLVNGVLLATPYIYGAASPGLPLAFTAWSITEIIRYFYYFINLTSTVPHVLIWLRYTLFIVLYPLGVTGELLCLYAAVKYAIVNPDSWSYVLPNKLNFTFSYLYLLITVMLFYIPGFPPLYLHMFAQRRKILNPSATAKKTH